MFKCKKCGKVIWSFRNSLCEECRIQIAVDKKMRQLKEKEEERRLEEQRKKEEEQRRQEEERRKQEEERRLEEQRKKEEEQRRQEEERKKEEEQRRQEEERRKKEEERRREEQRKKKEEQRRQEKERRKQEEERRLKALEHRRQEEEERHRREEEVRRRRKEEEERRRKEDDERKRQKALKKQAAAQNKKANCEITESKKDATTAVRAQEPPKQNLPQFEGFTLSQEQYDACCALNNTNDNYFVTGNAGTGKSVILRYFISHTKKKVAVVAPTGVAALNVGGETIHSFFSLAIGVQDTTSTADIRRQLARKIDLLLKFKNIDTIVIDEISMVRCDVMDMIDTKLKIARGSTQPFGGCQIIAFGDLYQLPPVVERKENKEEEGVEEYLRDRYSSVFFFGAPAVEQHPFKHIKLTQTHRQSDSRFIDALNAIRVGHNTPDVLAYINEHAKKASPSDEMMTVAPRRAAVEAINKEKLDAIDAQAHTYIAEVSDKRAFASSEQLPADMELVLKEGARVMLLKNDPHKRWVNGTVGTAKHLFSNSIEVEISGHTYTIDKETWTKYRYRYDAETKQLIKETVGTFKQFPVRLAYAITIHKSQGQTYDAVNIDYSNGASFEVGQTYVALSRCKTIDGVSLTVPMVADNIKVSSEVVQYMHDYEQDNSIPNQSDANNQHCVAWKS